MSSHGFMLAAPASGSGKTVLTLALIRALRSLGANVRPAKAGPDYIDPMFHALAAGRSSVNLDGWAMRPDLVRTLASEGDPLVVEAAMGLFDGASDGSGTAADLAAMLELPVVLVLDAARTSQSLGAVLRGFVTNDPRIRIAGTVVNRVASERHATMIRAAVAPVCEELGLQLLGMIPRHDDLVLPSRHLGLVPAGEHKGIEDFVQRAADLVLKAIDVNALANLERKEVSGGVTDGLPVLGTRIAIANDIACSFTYRHILDDWHRAGASLHPFSPLADEAPDEVADAVFLPGGFPELHAGRLATATCFRSGIRRAVDRGAWVYGECGGYMTLGNALIDADGCSHEMLGLLPLVTSFEKRRLHLGYRMMTFLQGTPFGPVGAVVRGHEFHHSTIIEEGPIESLFSVKDASGIALDRAGLMRGRVFGSYMHMIDRT